MNSDSHESRPVNREITSAASSSISNKRIRVRKRSSISNSVEASLPSIPSIHSVSGEADWVSPFTLPPLPSIRGRSPEHQPHNRSGSSAYYAAAWGSPYATPSPNTRFAQRRSFDQASSPLVTRNAIDRSLARARQNSIPSSGSAETAGSSSNPTSWEKRRQKRNWLSESGESGSDSDSAPEFGLTPTRRIHIRTNSHSAQSIPSSIKSHRFIKSVDTITPETFIGASGQYSSQMEDIPSADMNTPEITSSTTDMSKQSPSNDKPLPKLPTEDESLAEPTPAQTRPQLPIPTLSFNRPKKKVPWKGKSCMIAFPPGEREEEGLPPVMTAKEVQDRLQYWKDQGYLVDGFSIGDWHSHHNGAGSGSRTIFPDDVDMMIERKTSRAGVHIPDQAEWAAWVAYLKEEKLRALGVTPSTSEAPPSTMSPFSSTMSRVSSVYPMTASPPVPSASAMSNHSRIGSVMAPTPFSMHNAHGSISIPSLSQRGTPQLQNGRMGHGYAQSVAMPGMLQRIQSPYSEFTPSFVAGMRSPLEQFPGGRRPFSPGHVQNMQSMSYFPSPLGENAPNGFGRPGLQTVPSNTSIEQIRKAQELVQAQHQQVQAQLARVNHARQMSMFPVQMQSNNQVQTTASITPKIASPVRQEPPEILHPTPRSHRRDLSAALEKGVADEVAQTSKHLSEQIHGPSKQTSDEAEEELEDGEIKEESVLGDELPILQRPETIQEDDERVEIETNPSIAGTPMLLDDKNPFSNIRSFPAPSSGPRANGFGHSIQPSLSKLNVQAKEFNPSGTFSPAAEKVFNFGGNDLQLPAQRPVSNYTPAFTHKSSLSRLSINAAPFVPTGSNPFAPKISMSTTQVVPVTVMANSRLSNGVLEEAKMTPRQSAFNFSSANLNIAAPEFTPTGAISVNTIQGLTPQKPTENTPNKSSIFGDIVITPENNKIMRRDNTSSKQTKAVPIVRPSSRGSRTGTPSKITTKKEDSGLSEPLDADGRAIAPLERQKRARTVGLDGEDEAEFASSAPFTSLKDNTPPRSDKIDQGDETSSIEIVTSIEPVEQVDEVVPEDIKQSDKPSSEQEEPQVIAEIEESVLEGKQSVAATNRKASAGLITSKWAAASDDEAEKAETATMQTPARKPSITEAQTTATSEDKETLDPRSVPTPMISAPEDAKDGLRALLEGIKAENTSDVASGVVAPVESIKDHVLTVAKDEEKGSAQPITESPVVDDLPLRSLNAEAKSFTFNPSATFTPAAVTVQQPIRSTDSTKIFDNARPAHRAGLMDSRFASISPVPPIYDTPSKKPVNTLSPTVAEAKDSMPVEKVTEEKSPVFEMLQDDEQDGPGPEEVNTEESLISTLEDHNLSEQPGHQREESYEELDAVMRQMDEDPDGGIIRSDSPAKHSQTPLVDMRYPRQNFRSDGPSPSPRRLGRGFIPNTYRSDQPYRGLGFDMEGVHNLGFGSHRGTEDDWSNDLSPGQQDKLEARAHFFDDHVNDLYENILESRLAPLEQTLENIQNVLQGLNSRKQRKRPSTGHRSLSTTQKDSDADDEDDYNAYEGYDHYRSQSPGKRIDRVDRRYEMIKTAVLEAMAVSQANDPPQLDGPSIYESLIEIKKLAAQPIAPEVNLTELKAEIESFRQTQSQALQPNAEVTAMRTMLEELSNAHASKPDAKFSEALEPVRSILQELKLAQVDKVETPLPDLSSIHATLAELKQQNVLFSQKQAETDVRSIVSDVIASHPRFEEKKPVVDNEELIMLRVRLADAESMLKVAEKRADAEASLRREAEDENEQLHSNLKKAQEIASKFESTSVEAQKSLEAFLLEKQAYRELSSESQDLRRKNEELEKTLDEYRDYKEKVKEELHIERSRTDSLARTLDDIRDQYKQQSESREHLREQMKTLQTRMTKVVEDVQHDESEWRKREHDLQSKNQLLQSALDHETNRRARLELEQDKVLREARENLSFRSKHEHSQNEVARLASIIVELQADNKKLQETARHSHQELAFARQKHDDVIRSRTSQLQDELAHSRSLHESHRNDTETRVQSMQRQLDETYTQIAEQKARHERDMQTMFNNHNSALEKVQVSHIEDVDARLAAHEERLIVIKADHERAMRHVAEDKARLEAQHNTVISLEHAKIAHLEGKLVDLEDRLEITKSAARAAIEAATAKANIGQGNLPTPANSVVASPPHRASIGSAPAITSMNSSTVLPEKISPQALRETIMVLQEQLQNREARIDSLTSELSAIDKDAPRTVRERDTEILLLRELLDVRLDELQDLITELEKPSYNAQAARDVAVRLKTQIKMEQQLKERAILAQPSIILPQSVASGLNTLDEYTKSPRQMVAAAAWGNWTKVRNSSLGSSLADYAQSAVAGSPSRSNLLERMKSPPSSDSTPGASRPLAQVAAARRRNDSASGSPAPRVLRSISTQPRTLSSKQSLEPFNTPRPLRRGTNDSIASTSSVVRRPLAGLINQGPEPSSTKVEPPATPLHLRTTGEDSDDFTEDMDEDASPLDGKNVSERSQGYAEGEMADLVKMERKSAKQEVSGGGSVIGGSPLSKEVSHGHDEGHVEEEYRVIVDEEAED